MTLELSFYFFLFFFPGSAPAYGSGEFLSLLVFMKLDMEGSPGTNQRAPGHGFLHSVDRSIGEIPFGMGKFPCMVFLDWAALVIIAWNVTSVLCRVRIE